MYSHTHCALRCSHIRREKPAAHNVIPIVPSTRIHTASPITFVSSLTLALLNECIFYDLLFYADIQVLLLPATFPLRAFFSTTIFFKDFQDILCRAELWSVLTWASPQCLQIPKQVKMMHYWQSSYGMLHSWQNNANPTTKECVPKTASYIDSLPPTIFIYCMYYHPQNDKQNLFRTSLS